MDEDLTALKRAFEVEPTDRGAAERYVAALKRAGREDDARQLFELKFRCPLEWEQLRATDYQGVRFCDSCQRNVYFVDSVEALAIHVRERRCVAYLADASSDVFETI